MRVATAAPDGLHTHEDAEVLIDFGDAGVLSGRRDSPQSRPPFCSGSFSVPVRTDSWNLPKGSTSSRRYTQLSEQPQRNRHSVREHLP